METIIVKIYVAVSGLPERAPQNQKYYKAAYTLQALDENANELKRKTIKIDIGKDTTTHRAILQTVISALDSMASFNYVFIIVTNLQDLAKSGRGEFARNSNADLWENIDALQEKIKANDAQILWRHTSEDPQAELFTLTKAMLNAD